MCRVSSSKSYDQPIYLYSSVVPSSTIFPVDSDVFLEDFREKISKIIVVGEGEEEKERKRRFGVL